jgi:hypothetical protein
VATNEKNAGPQVGQMVIYNSSGTKKPAVIYAVTSAPNWTVSLLFFDSTPATSQTGVSYDPKGDTSGAWSYPLYI